MGVLGLTCVNHRYANYVGVVLPQLLMKCGAGDDWRLCNDAQPRFLRNAIGKRIYLWTAHDGITQSRIENDGNHHYRKDTNKIWDDLKHFEHLDCPVDERNTICLDIKKENFESMESVIEAHGWSNDGWVWGNPVEPLEPMDDSLEEKLRVFLNDVLDGVDVGYFKYPQPRDPKARNPDDIRTLLPVYHA